MKILVTGSTGVIGENLVAELLKQGYNVSLILRANSRKVALYNRLQTYIYDKNIESLISWFLKEKFDGIIHLASLYKPTHTEKDISNLIHSNIEFGTHLLEAATKSNVAWFLNSGTFWQNYQSESYNPVNLYAATKEAFEAIAKFYTETSDLTFVTLKLNDTFGANDTRNKIFNLWQNIAESGEILEMSQGEQIIDISYIEDVLSAYTLLIEQLLSDTKETLKNQHFVVSAEKRVTLRELAKIFENVTHTKLNIKWGAKPYREREVMLPLSSGNLVPGWEQQYSLTKAISLTMENK